MQYLGSKRRICKDILKILSDLREQYGSTRYIEPFVGSGSIYTHIPMGWNKCGGDSNKYLVALLSEASEGRVFPTDISESEYHEVRKNLDRDPALSAFIGFGCSFGGKWFGGYARNKNRDSYARRASNSLRELEGACGGLRCCGYSHWAPADGDLVYCDPPYAGTTGYGKPAGTWDPEKFWTWAGDAAECGAVVVVSEYTAPSGVEIYWEREVGHNMDATRPTTSRRERIFVLRPGEWVPDTAARSRITLDVLRSTVYSRAGA